MGETAEERRRRLVSKANAYANAVNVLQNSWFGRCSNDDYKQTLDDICREICDEPRVSLVKKYNKGSFKFV